MAKDEVRCGLRKRTLRKWQEDHGLSAEMAGDALQPDADTQRRERMVSRAEMEEATAHALVVLLRRRVAMYCP